MVESCTILTTVSNEMVANIHDRMPVTIPREKYHLWLNPEVEDCEAVKDILKPYDASLMRQYPVSPKLNNANNEDPECAAPIMPGSPEQDSLF